VSSPRLSTLGPVRLRAKPDFLGGSLKTLVLPEPELIEAGYGARPRKVSFWLHRSRVVDSLGGPFVSVTWW